MTKQTHTFNKIKIFKNKNYLNNSKSCISISLNEKKNGFIYFSWDDNRIYFFLDKLKKSQNNISIKEIKLDDNHGIFSFIYDGD